MTPGRKNTEKCQMHSAVELVELEFVILILDRAKVMRMPQTFILHLQEMSKR
jgi:hypothetical protein